MYISQNMLFGKRWPPDVSRYAKTSMVPWKFIDPLFQAIPQTAFNPGSLNPTRGEKMPFLFGAT
jgi:hypothetical protein